MKTYRVLIADDHPLSRSAIRSLLQGDPSFEIVAEVANGLDAIRNCERLLPDLVLMDINMPTLNGLEATRQIKKRFPQIQIVILSVSDDVADLFTAIQYGAQGYLLKNLEPEDWLNYLHALLGEDIQISREMASRIFHNFHAEDRTEQERLTVLTAREKEILRCIAAGETNRQIADQLFITENTVKNHIKNLLAKLEVDNRVQLAKIALMSHFPTDK